MSMEEDTNNLREMKKDADMRDAVSDLARIRLIIEHVLVGAEITLGLDHLGYSAINESAGLVQGEIDRVHAALKNFENTVKNVADAVIQSLS